MNASLHLNNLKYRYRSFTLGHVEMELETGHVAGLIGPNGAGKSTLINCLAGFLRPFEGSMEIDGGKVIEAASGGSNPFKSQLSPGWKTDVGYAGEAARFYDRWPVKKNLDLVSKYYPNWSNDFLAGLLERVQLDETKTVKSLSRGNRMKLALISALAYKPRLLLFDEPADGLDPEIREEMIAVLKDLMQDENRSILLATHHPAEYSSILDEIIFLRDGKLELHEPVDIVSDRWVRISFSASEFTYEIDSVISSKSQGNEHQLISFNRDSSLKDLELLGIKDPLVSWLDLNEISKWMMKGDKNVVTG